MKKLADTEWLLLVLLTVNPRSEVFRSDYYYQRPRNTVAQQASLVDNSDNFFDDLPELPLSKQKRCGMLRLSKADKI